MTTRLSPATWCLVGLLTLSTAASTAVAQTATVAAATAPTRLLVAHPVVAALTTTLVRDTGIVVLRPVPETLPANRQLAFFTGRGAAGLGDAARQADAVVALRSIWPDDPLFPLARRQNIRLIEIDAARPLDASLPGMALQEQQGAAVNALPWLDPVNLGRMADVIASDVARLVPAARPRLQANVTALRQQVLADEAWTPEVLADLTQRLRSASVAAVLHHRELPPALAQAVQQAGVRSIVLLTEGRDPVGELRENSQRLGAIAVR